MRMNRFYEVEYNEEKMRERGKNVSKPEEGGGGGK